MPDEILTTVAQESGFRTTGRTDEVECLCEAFARRWPDAVRCIEFGRSAEGRPMLALIASRSDPRRVPMLMIQGGIHPGESDGKDGGFAPGVLSAAPRLLGCPVQSVSGVSC